MVDRICLPRLRWYTPMTIMTKMTISVANTDALLGSAFWDSVMMHMRVSAFHSVLGYES
jgi:hypothetical protein